MKYDKFYFNKFLAIDALFEGGRMFVGATSVTYLLSQGISMSEIAGLKSLQAAVLMFGEIPTGVFADSFGRRLSLICGGLCAIAGFLIYYFASSLIWYFAAEAFCALSLCFWSGAFESCAIDYSKLEKEESALNRFFHLNMAINNSSVLLLGFVGGWIGSMGINLPYIGAVFCYILMLYLLITLPKEVNLEYTAHVSWILNIRRHIVAAFKEGILHPALLPFFVANIGIQFLIQPLLHYWQPFFKTLDPAITSTTHGMIFSLYCGLSAIFAFTYSRFSNRDFVKKPMTIALLFLIFCCLYFYISRSNNLWVAAGLFALLQGFLSLCRTSLSINMNREINSQSRASILSTLSLFSRLGMVGALFVISQMLEKNNSNLKEIYNLFSLMSFALIIFAMIGMVLLGKKNDKNS